MDTLQQFLSDPQNRIIAHVIAGFLVLDGLVLLLLARRMTGRERAGRGGDTVEDMRRARGGAPLGPAALIRVSATLSLALAVGLLILISLLPAP